MSCAGDNWVVPGANPCNQTSSTTSSSVMLVGTTGASLTIPLANNTSTLIQTLTFTTTSDGYIIINGNTTFTTSSNTKYDLSLHFTVNGTMVQNELNKDTIDGIGHFCNSALTGSCDLPAGKHTVNFYVLTNAPTNTIKSLCNNFNAIIYLSATTVNEATPVDNYYPAV